jgi:hypothetical protein
MLLKELDENPNLQKMQGWLDHVLGAVRPLSPGTKN